MTNPKALYISGFRSHNQIDSPMDLHTCITIVFSLCICFLISFLFSLLFSSKTSNTRKPPPGPPTLHFIANFLWHRKPFFELGKMVSGLRKRYGPIITIKIGFQPTIFIINGSLACQALVLNGAIFADRPKTSFVDRILPNKRKSLSLLPYGTTWRTLRRNLTGTSGILHPAHLIYCSHIRKRVLDNLIHRLKQESVHGRGVHVVDHFTYTVFTLLVFMCFGDNLDENTVRELECSQHKFFTYFPRVKVFLVMPNLGKILFRNRWNEFVNILKDREDLFVSLIRARKKVRQVENEGENMEKFVSYVDTLLECQVPGENKNLSECEMVSLIDEFISAGTDTTTTALHWIMANLVKYPIIQEKILVEMRGAVEQGQQWIKGDDLQKLPYLKAVVLEGLRRHPPTYQAATPHAVTDDTQLGGYLIPKGTTVNFLIADMGRDPNVWKDPMEFKPERFLFGPGEESFDITGSREIKMMPFGAGRRICPGLGFAFVHLEYFVANLIWHFEWRAVDGKDIDLSEKIDVTIKMKNPLQVLLFSRSI